MSDDDLIAGLRDYHDIRRVQLCGEAADRITALREELAEAHKSISDLIHMGNDRADERDALQAKLNRVNAWLIEGDPEISLRLILDSDPSVSLDAVKQRHRTSAANCRKSTHGEPISSGNVCEACRETEGQS